MFSRASGNCPPEQQEALAVEIAFRLDSETQGSVFTDEEWAKIESTMDSSGEDIPHAQVVSEMQPGFLDEACLATAGSGRVRASGSTRVRAQILHSVSFLADWPDLGRKARRDYRELVVPHSPYVVIYRRTIADPHVGGGAGAGSSVGGTVSGTGPL
ncbi:MAG: type II toxin-antitoxin system RelE/ParE family toxin [Hyphomonadaceae bacterium]|nr:type II toxin-antitoxin system RelE/ParE family toxin [Hyphomonadaceae bacterium]